MAKLRQSLVVITGCSSGLGATLVRIFLQKGYSVLAVIRSKKEPGMIADLVGREGLAVVAVNLEESLGSKVILEKVRSLIDQGLILDTVIFNAGKHCSDPVEVAELSLARRIMELHFFSVLTCVQNLIPIMNSQGGGKLLAISSLSAHIGLAGDAIYAASKAAVERLFESLSVELAGSGVKVGLVVPGAFESNLMRRKEKYTKHENSSLIEVASKVIKFVEADVAGFLCPANQQAEQVLTKLGGANFSERQRLAVEWSANWR